MTTFAELRAGVAALALLAGAPCALADTTTLRVGSLVYAEDPVADWNLPPQLRELSGFATDAKGRLFAHDDENAVVHELDYAQGRIVKSFAFGNPPLRGDFEGLTLIDDRFCLTDSNGTLICGNEGAAGAHVAFERIETGAGKLCEIEGVEYAADADLLYFACKTARVPDLENHIAVIAWSLTERAQVPARSLKFDLEQFADLPGDGRLRPSDVTLTPDGRSLVLSAAKRRALITLARDGSTASAVQLPDSKDLKQIEAVAFGSGDALLVGSEGKKKQGQGRMRVYHVAD
jgi:hypothetical protein